jgi:hypothetical protein
MVIRKIISCILLALLISCSLSTKNEEFIIADIDKDIDNLISCNLFTTDRIAASGKYSIYSVCFSRLMISNDALKNFKYIAKNAYHNEGKCYALLALYKLDKKEYYNQKDIIHDNDCIKVMWGCIIQRWSIDEFYTKIEKEILYDNIMIPEVRNINENYILIPEL